MIFRILVGEPLYKLRRPGWQLERQAQGTYCHETNAPLPLAQRNLGNPQAADLEANAGWFLLQLR